MPQNRPGAAAASTANATANAKAAANATANATANAASKSAAPERWALSAGDAASAVLLIPADLHRDRRFEIACALTVSVPDAAAHPAAAQPALQMTVSANGAQQWQRKVPAHNPGAWDGLDYRFSRSVPAGQALRVQVAVACQGGARRRSLAIDADEI